MHKHYKSVWCGFTDGRISVYNFINKGNTIQKFKDLTNIKNSKAKINCIVACFYTPSTTSTPASTSQTSSTTTTTTSSTSTKPLSTVWVANGRYYIYIYIHTYNTKTRRDISSYTPNAHIYTHITHTYYTYTSHITYITHISHTHTHTHTNSTIVQYDGFTGSVIRTLPSHHTSPVTHMTVCSSRVPSIATTTTSKNSKYIHIYVCIYVRIYIYMHVYVHLYFYCYYNYTHAYTHAHTNI